MADPLLTPALLNRLERFRLRFGALTGSARLGERASVTLGSGIEFRDSRRYAPGDDLRHLDWHALGRLDQLFTKQFETFGELTLTLVLDRADTMACGALDAPYDMSARAYGRAGHKLTFAHRLAAALGFVALNARDAVRVVPFPAVPARVETWRGRAAITRLIDSIATLRPEPARRADDRALLERVLEPRRQQPVLVISDAHDADAWFRRLRAIRLRQRSVTLFHLVAPAERHPMLEGPIELRDVGRGAGRARLEISAKLTAAYRAAFERHLRRVQSYCAEHGIGYVALDTDLPFGTSLFHRLKHRGVWDT